MSNISLIDGHIDNAEHCVCCGAVIPEGRQVCIICGLKTNYKQSTADMVEVVRCSKIKAEAYKECLAKVKNYIKTHCNPYGKPDFDYDTSIKILNFIDNLVKETVGENNE